MPVDLLRTIAHASKILDWHENLMEDDIPPEWMWPFDKALTEWFDEVRQANALGASKEPDDRTIVPLMDNELSEGRR